MILVQWASSQQEDFFFEAYEDDEYLNALEHYKRRVPEWATARMILESEPRSKFDWVVVHSNYEYGGYNGGV